ncbi:MAG: hypothetical protein VR68_01495 [Peptococcaceae bacterium BRH_c4a]|nr:MAG: hypothetical protein VR68_01495 [Peptococcaceae bacterium BRH_c4a]
MSRISWLKKETEAWVGKGIVTVDQAGRIMELYPEDNRNRLISALLVLGAILVGAGIILFFASNWEYIPKWVRVGIIIAAMVSFYLSSHLASGGYPKVSAALLLLGCVAFGSGIWLIAQIFHINSHFPNGILFWLLGVLPVAFFLKEHLPLALSSLLLGAWVAVEHDLSPFVILAAVFLFAAVFYLNYQMPSPFALAVSLISAVIFINKEIYLVYEQYLNHNGGFRPDNLLSIVPIVTLLSGQLLAVMAGVSANSKRNFTFIYSLLGIVISGFSLYLMSFVEFSRMFEKFSRDGTYWPLLALCAISVGAGLYFIKKQGDLKSGMKDNIPWLVTVAAVLMVLLVSPGKPYLVVMLNLVMFIWALAVIAAGYRTQNTFCFTLGILAFTFFTITEYFNLFWEMLPKSLFFMVGGVVLMVGGALLERQRRKLVGSWKASKGGGGDETRA